ncbi:MAG: hypothetical protein ABSH38_15105 [Verrucomicrobiota bacterium]|jgi:hypothetical protein
MKLQKLSNLLEKSMLRGFLPLFWSFLVKKMGVGLDFVRRLEDKSHSCACMLQARA